MESGQKLVTERLHKIEAVSDLKAALAFGLIEHAPANIRLARLTKKGIEFFKWVILNEKPK